LFYSHKMKENWISKEMLIDEIIQEWLDTFIIGSLFRRYRTFCLRQQAIIALKLQNDALDYQIKLLWPTDSNRVPNFDFKKSYDETNKLRKKQNEILRLIQELEQGADPMLVLLSRNLD
jgi:hypothetical protein